MKSEHWEREGKLNLSREFVFRDGTLGGTVKQSLSRQGRWYQTAVCGLLRGSCNQCSVYHSEDDDDFTAAFAFWEFFLSLMGNQVAVRSFGQHLSRYLPFNPLSFKILLMAHFHLRPTLTCHVCFRMFAVNVYLPMLVFKFSVPYVLEAVKGK